MGSILDHKVIEKNSRLSLAIAKDNLYLFLAIFAIFIFYYLAEPNGVDWSYYSNVKPKYELIYFQREIFSWFLIDIFNNIDKSGILFSSIISSFLMIATYKTSLQLSNDKSIACLTTIFLLFSNFYLLLSVNGIRQGISLIFILFAILNYIRGINHFYFLWFLLSILSHNSAFLLAPLFLVKYIPSYLFLTGCFLLPFLGQFIASLASKNNNPSPNENKEIFLLLSVFLVILSLFHQLNNKYKQNKFISNRNFYLIFLYVFITLTSFYFSSAIYERLIYTCLPIMIIMFGYFINTYKPKWIFLLMYLTIVIMFSFYSLTHPSVTNNFINL